MTTNLAPSAEDLRWMYDRMVVSREFELMLGRAYLEGKQPIFNMAAGPLPGEMHLSNGQEPCAVGVCAHLSKDDYVVATHRPHHVAIAKGVPLKEMAAEIFGRVTGLSGGKGGHMHLYAPEVSFACSGIVGQGIGIGVGHALAIQMRGGHEVAVAYAGEGAANQGMFHEAMNLAGLWKLPFILVIEDNDWGVSVCKSRSTAIARNSDRAAAYGAAGFHVAANDVWGVHAAARIAVDRARNGEGPSIIEIETYRLAGHFVGDPEIYVPETDRQSRTDPIEVMRARMLAEGVLSEAEFAAIHEAAVAEVREAEGFARESAEPAPADALDNVFMGAC